MKDVLELRDKVLKVLKGELKGFYLAGGTALSLYYFNHRESFDLDFFTKGFSKQRVKEIINHISTALKVKIELESEESRKGLAKQLIYYAVKGKTKSLKIDFIEDAVDVMEAIKLFDGVPVLSKEDIYLRKIHTVSGTHEMEDKTGKKVFHGGRQEAKDFFDLYHLSKVFVPLADFAAANCSLNEEEGLIVWFSSYNKTLIKEGLNEIITRQKPNYVEMEKHFKAEIEKIVERKIK